MEVNRENLVSVIIPTRNRRKLLIEAVESVINQTWANLEIIIIDDASDDDTFAELEKIAQRHYLVIIHNEISKGGAVTRNQGIAIATGKYVAFLDDDDTWVSTKLEKQIQLFEQTPNCSVVTCYYIEKYIKKASKLIKVNQVVDEQQLLMRNSLAGASMYLTTLKNLKLVGGFDPQLKSGQDWELLIKLWSIGPIVVCKEPLVAYLAHNSVRISNSYKSSYEGLRDIYFKYKTRMSFETRCFQLAELMFYRIKLDEKQSFNKLSEFYKVLKHLKFTNSIIFLLRYIRFFAFEKTTR